MLVNKCIEKNGDKTPKVHNIPYTHTSNKLFFQKLLTSHHHHSVVTSSIYWMYVQHEKESHSFTFITFFYTNFTVIEDILIFYIYVYCAYIVCIVYRDGVNQKWKYDDNEMKKKTFQNQPNYFKNESIIF